MNMRLSRKSFLGTLGGVIAAGALEWPSVRLAEAGQATGVGTKTLKISGVDLYPYTIPSKKPQRIALGSFTGTDGVFVRIRTSAGVTGLGEVAPFTPVMSETQQSDVAVGKAFADLVRGRSPFAIPEIVQAMDAMSPHNGGIKAAFEMALWDICGKVAGLPVHRLLGTYRESFETDLTVHLETPQEMVRLAQDVVRQGFKNMKIKLGESPALDIERVKAIRTAVGPDIKLRVDANQGWSPTDAVIALRGIESAGIQFCEQPVPYWDWEGLKYIRGKVAVPLFADESVHSPHDAMAGIRHEAMDGINIKLMKSGGILQGMRIATIADAANLPCMVGCMAESRVALTAGAHLVMSQRNIRYADLDGFFMAAVDPVIGGMQVKDGVVTVPDTPGLGVDLDPAFLAKLKPVT
jgi:L-Ala-D/L-Glu epimerase